jgi:protein-tyrosine phosphatase
VTRAIIIVILFCGWIVAAAGVEPVKNVTGEKQVLFICTGNFYRSRFAEALFNQKAHEAHLGWRAISRGLNLVPWQLGISKYAQQELMKRGVARQLMAGSPKRLTNQDLMRSDCVILMDEAEHRTVFEKKFPSAPEGNVYYWHVPDSGKLQPSDACELISENVARLIERLKSN